MDKGLILQARKEYHKALVDNNVLSLSSDGVASNADGSNVPSKAIAKYIAEKNRGKSRHKG